MGAIRKPLMGVPFSPQIPNLRCQQAKIYDAYYHLIHILRRTKISAVKEQAIKIIESLPEDCTLEDIQYHLYVREKVERGINAIDEGQTVSHEEAEKKVREWLK